MKITSLTVLALFVVFSVSGQESEFADGFIITNSGDTLSGSVKDRKFGFNDELIDKLVIKLENGRTRKVKKKNIQVYRWGNEIFERRKMSEIVPILKFEVSSESFLVQVESGAVELYKHYYNDFDNHTIDYVFFIKDRLSSNYKRLPVIGYRAIIRKYFLGKEEITEKLYTGKFRYADIPDLIREGNSELRK